MKTKSEVMQSVWDQHGKATSVMDLCYALRKQWPNKTESYKKECLDFLVKKKTEQNTVQKSGADAPFRELPQLLQSMKDQLIARLCPQLEGMKYSGL